MNHLMISKKSLVRGMTMLTTLAILLSIVGPALAGADRAAPVVNVPLAVSPPLGPTDPAELEAFLDDLFGKAM